MAINHMNVQVYPPEVFNIDEITQENMFFRTVVKTTDRTQLTVMMLRPGQDIGLEVHQVDQFIKIEQGTGLAYLNGDYYELIPGYSITIPRGTPHNIMNWDLNENPGAVDLKIYTIYSGVLHPANEIVVEKPIV